MIGPASSFDVALIASAANSEVVDLSAKVAEILPCPPQLVGSGRVGDVLYTPKVSGPPEIDDAAAMISAQCAYLRQVVLPEARSRSGESIARLPLNKSELKERLQLTYNQDGAKAIRLLQQVDSVSGELFDVLRLNPGIIRKLCRSKEIGDCR